MPEEAKYRDGDGVTEKELIGARKHVGGKSANAPPAYPRLLKITYVARSSGKGA